jgi:hypothetical protein
MLLAATAGAQAATYLYRVPVPGLAATATAPSTPTGDPYFADVKLLLHFDGNYADQIGHSLTAVGSPTFTASGKFGSAVNLATQMSYLSMPSSSDFNFGTNDFTIEAWVDPVVTAGSNTDYSIYYQGEDHSTNLNLVSFEVLGQASGTAVLRFVTRNGSATVADISGGSVPYNQWSHVAIVRSGASLNLYQNGSLAATTNIGAATALPFPSMYAISIGARSNVGTVGGGSFPGLLDEVRITNGYARYTGSSYTVPSAAFPNN